MLRVQVLRALACTLVLLACDGPGESKTSAPATDAASASSATATSAESPGEPVRGDWLVIHTLADPENLNPLTSNDFGASQVLGWIFPTLVRIDQNTLALEPLLATELPEVTPDHLTYTYHLRDDITFSDGKPLTAEDVVFTLKAIRHPGVNAAPLRNYYNSVADAVVVDPHTVRISLGEVYFLNDWQLGGIGPIPRHYYDPENLLDGISVADLNHWDALEPAKKERAERFAKHFNESFNRSPLGAGALVLEDPARDYVTGEKIELRHRDGFFAPGQPLLGDPWVDRVVYRVINDLDAALAARKAGAVDFIGLRPVQYLKQTNDPRFDEQSVKHVDRAGSYTYIGWNQKRAIFSDKRVRQALSHLVDKRNVCDKLLLGLADPVESPIYPGRPEFNANLPTWPFDPAKAKALLAEAGWSDTDGDGILDKEVDGVRVPLRFEIVSNSGNDDRRNLGLVVVDEFKRAGIDASFRAIDWSILLEKVKSFDYDAVVLGWTNSGTIPPDLFQIFHSSQAVPGGSNHISFKNAEVDGLLEAYRIEFDATKRKAMYDRVQEILYDEQPYTWVYAPKSLSAYDRRFRGVTWYPTGATQEPEWWVPVASQKYR
jgi:peptide/nickel transport system substrate-binding protein